MSLRNSMTQIHKLIIPIEANRYHNLLRSEAKLKHSISNMAIAPTSTIESDAKKPRINLEGDKKTGAYKRHESAHRNFVGTDQHPVEAGRYHLHVALACPWADGALAGLFLKGLEDTISYSVVHPTWSKTKPDDPNDEHHGWVYRSSGDEALPNPLGHGANECDDALFPDPSGIKSVREIYELSGDYQGPFTTPVLFDKKLNRIVNNESTEVLRMLNFDFNDFAKNAELNLYPEDKEAELSKLNETTIYPKVNNGVYRSGFARSQEAYEVAVKDVFDALEELEQRLSNQRYLSGDEFTWLDLRLFMTLVRFDPVYTTYFKTNLKRIDDYPNLLGYIRDIYSMDPIKRSINMKHIKTHYFTSHPHLNTFGIIPISNGPDLEVPSGREKLSM